MPARPCPPPPWAPHPAGSLRSSPGASLSFPEDSRQDSTSSTWFQGLQGSHSDLFSVQISPQCRPFMTSLFKITTHLPTQPYLSPLTHFVYNTHHHPKHCMDLTCLSSVKTRQQLLLHVPVPAGSLVHTSVPGPWGGAQHVYV